MSSIDFNTVVLTTRVRLARNFKDYPFVSCMNSDIANKVLNDVKEAIYSSNKDASNKYKFYDREFIIKNGGVLMEEHYISPNFLKLNRPIGVLLNEQEGISIMINEEDHLRIQVLKDGYDLDNCFKEASLLDDLLEEKREYAFSEKYGYLTSCPTNVGTGLRASVMLHLPAIVKAGRINELVQSVNKLGIAVRGIFGEGSEARGNLFQFSNQITLGISEKEIIEKLKNIIKQIVEQEVNLRYQIKNDNLLDSIYRANGILKNSYLISYNEFMDLWSYVLLGIDLSLIEKINRKEFIDLINKCGPYNILNDSKQTLDSNGRDKYRSSLLKTVLK